MTWLNNTIGNITSWLGDGLGRFFQWLISGIGTVITKVVSALSGVFDVLDSIWDFAVGMVQDLISLVSYAFPFIPEAVIAVISGAIMVSLVAGIFKRVKG